MTSHEKCIDNSLLNGINQTSPLHQLRMTWHQKLLQQKQAGCKYLAVTPTQTSGMQILGCVSSTNKRDANTKLSLQHKQADCKHLAVSPTSCAQVVSPTWSTNPSRDSFLGCSTNTTKKKNIPPMTMQSYTTERVIIVRELLCTQQTPHAHAPSGPRRQVSCSCGHSLPRTDELTVCLASNQRPASSIQQRRFSDM